MSKYTTGEIAKLCGVSVRTVQYYDSRNILTPSELSEGGRRLYSEDDLERMKIICFLRELDLPLSSIGDLLSEEQPEKIISMLLDEQERLLQEEIEEKQTKLDRLSELKKALKTVEHFSVESIGDMVYALENKKKMRQLHIILLISGIPIGILQWTSIILWIVSGIWWLLVIYISIGILYALWMTKYYFKRIAYICPQCHAVFKATRKEAIFAGHTLTLRKLTCTACGYHGFCMETYGKEK